MCCGGAKDCVDGEVAVLNPVGCGTVMEAKVIAEYQERRYVQQAVSEAKEMHERPLVQDVPAEVGNYSLGYQRGFDQGNAEGRRHALQEVEEFITEQPELDPVYAHALLRAFRTHFLPRSQSTRV